MGLFDRDYMRFPSGPRDAYFNWLNDVGLSSRTEPGLDVGAAPGETLGGGGVFAWIGGSVLVGLALGVAVYLAGA